MPRSVKSQVVNRTLPHYPTQANISEAQAAIALLGIDIAEGGLPAGRIREADGMPDNVTPGNTPDMEITIHIGTIHTLEAEVAIALLGIDIAEGGLPAGRIREADGMPDDATFVNGADMQITTN